jgi:hypothetical protein
MQEIAQSVESNFPVIVHSGRKKNKLDFSSKKKTISNILVNADGNEMFSSFAGKKLVTVLTSLSTALAFTYALYPVLNYEFPAKASWTWEIIQRMFASTESDKGILRGQKKDPHGLNKCDCLCGEVSKIVEEMEVCFKFKFYINISSDKLFFFLGKLKAPKVQCNVTTIVRTQ